MTGLLNQESCTILLDENRFSWKDIVDPVTGFKGRWMNLGSDKVTEQNANLQTFSPDYLIAAGF